MKAYLIIFKVKENKP